MQFAKNSTSEYTLPYPTLPTAAGVTHACVSCPGLLASRRAIRPPLALLIALLCFAWDTHAKVVGGSQFLLLLLLDARSLRIQRTATWTIR